MPFGYIDTTYVDLAPGLDEGYLRSLETRSGLSVAEMIQRVDAAMSAINEGADPLVAALSYRTASANAGTRVTATKRVTRGGEYTFARPQKITRVGYMLPIAKFDMSIGFTEDGLEEISSASFDEELDAMVGGFQRFYTAAVLDRLFSNAEVPVDDTTTVVSPGFAGSGTGTNVFSGVYPDGSDIAGGYTHYGYGTTDASIITWLDSQVAVMEKWQTGPFDLIASAAGMTALVAAAAAASKPVIMSGSSLIRLPDSQSEALVDADTYFGVYGGKVRLRYGVSGFGDNHFALFKSQGAFADGNPIAWRYDPLRGADAFVRSRALFPLADAVALQWLGFGVGNRTAASLFYRAGGAVAYVNPTITIV